MKNKVQRKTRGRRGEQKCYGRREWRSESDEEEEAKTQENAEKPEETPVQCRERENSPQRMHSAVIG